MKKRPFSTKKSSEIEQKSKRGHEMHQCWTDFDYFGTERVAPLRASNRYQNKIQKVINESYGRSTLITKFGLQFIINDERYIYGDMDGYPNVTVITIHQ